MRLNLGWEHANNKSSLNEILKLTQNMCSISVAYLFSEFLLKINNGQNFSMSGFFTEVKFDLSFILTPQEDNVTEILGRKITSSMNYYHSSDIIIFNIV